MPVYTPQTWANGPSGGTPLNAARLQHIEDGLTALAAGPPITTGQPRYDVAGFGSVATSNDRRATLQAAINTWALTGGELNINGSYDISGGSVTLPATPLGSHTIWSIRGSNDALLNTTSAHPLITDTVPADATVMVNRANRKFVFKNLHLKGTGNASQTLLRIIGSFGTTLQDVVVESGGDGVDLIFALQPMLINCKSVNNLTNSLRLRSATGIVTGATGSNSGTNCAHVIGWRDYCSAGQNASINLFEADGAILDNLITEGNDPAYSVYFDANSNTTVKSLTIRGWHNEHDPSTAGLRLTNFSGGIANIALPFWQSPQTIIDATGCGTGLTVRVTDMPFWVAGSFFKGDQFGAYWFFDGHVAGINPRDATYWVGGTVPDYSGTIRPSVGADALGGTYTVFETYSLLMKAIASEIRGTAWGVTLTGGTNEGVVLNGGSNGNVKVGATGQKVGFMGATPVVQQAANPDTSGATLGDLETEVNELKALLRTYGLLAT